MLYTSPLISIIIPLYNKSSSIKGTVNSVLAQSFKNYELIIINDGSTDGSLDVMSKFSDCRIKIFSIVNGGVSNARNHGIEKALGDYIFFLDADDIIMPNCLSIFVDRLVNIKGDFIFAANFNILFEDGTLKNFSPYNQEGLVNNIEKKIWKRKVFPRTGSMLIPKTFFNQIDLWFNKKISVYEDMDLILRLISKFEVYYIPLVVMNYQLEYNSLSKKIKPYNNEWVYHMDDLTFKGGFYKKLIASQIVYDTYLKRLKAKDTETVKELEVIIKKYFFFMVYSILDRKIMAFFEKLKTN